LRIYKLLPVVLAIALPGIGFFLYENNSVQTIPLAYQWLYTSVVLFSLWHLLSASWRFRDSYKKLFYLSISIPIFLLIVSFISLSLGVKENLGFDAKELIRTGFLFLIFLIIQFSRESQRKVDQLRIEREQLSQENYKVQLQSLRNQIDPHFLFNSLNTLRSMVRQNHSNSEEFIFNLSDFYRSTLKYSEETTLAISAELALLNSYLQLMKSRNEEAVDFKISTIEKPYTNFFLPSFALQNVVENCFKHNSMSSKKPLHIQILGTTDGYIEVSNTVQEKLTQDSTTGMGLKLLERRYKLLGIDKGVIVSKQNGIFKVRLKLINPNNERINS
jgi:two-component system LytT family sensor kinase